jgi:hypothetical protein
MADPYTLKVTKQKDGAGGLVVPVKRLSVAQSCVLVRTTPKADDEGAAALGTFEVLKEMSSADDERGISSGEWQKATGLPSRTFYRHQKRLLERGFVQNVGTTKMPRYRPTDVQ